MPLAICFSNRETRHVEQSITLGRGNPVCWAHPGVSREHVRLSPVPDVPEVIRLENIGINPVVVESLLSEGRSDGGTWDLTDLLDCGMQTLLSTRSRFFIASLEDTVTTIQSGDQLPSTSARSTDEPPNKKSKTEAGEAVQTSSTPHAQQDCPFSLLRVRGLQQRHNEGCLGAYLADYISGPMKLVLVSNYMIDLPWLLSACPEFKSAEKLLFVHGEHGEAEAAMLTTLRLAGLLQQSVCHKPPLPIQWGTHHSKAFLVHYATGVRVVVHTANLIYGDCNSKTQGFWVQDFPPKAAGSPPTSEFEQDLADYLRALKLPLASAREVADIVSRHDFSSARAKLIVSVPGYHTAPKHTSYGHMALRAALAKEVFPEEFRDAATLIQCSSLGSLDEKWLLGEFGASLTSGRFNAATGRGCEHVHDNWQQRLVASALDPTGPSLQQPTMSASKLSIVWPTVEEIRNSLEGWAAGASVPGPEKNVSKAFLQRHWCKFGGEPVGRQRAMPHIKTYCRYLGNRLPWFLVASHNLSKAAWGTLQKNGTQLMIRSYELGVLMLPSLEAAYRVHPSRGFSCTSSSVPSSSDPASASPQSPPCVEFVALTGSPVLEGVSQPGSSSSSGTAAPGGVQRVTLPVPYQLPPQPYGSGDRPWMCDVVFPGVDSLGRTIGHPFSMYGHEEPKG